MQHMVTPVESRFSLRGFFSYHWLHLMLGELALVFAIPLSVVAVQEKDSLTFYGAIPFLVCLYAAGIAVNSYVFWSFFSYPTVVRVNQQGISWERGGRKEAYQWERFQELHRKEVLLVHGKRPDKPSDWDRMSKLTIVFDDSTKLSLNHSLSNYNLLAKEIQGAATEVIWAKKETEVNQGEGRFGSVILRRNGVRLLNQDYLWTEIEYSIYNGFIVLVPAGDTFSDKDRIEIALSTIPNYLVLLGLMGKVGKAPVHPLMTFPKDWRANMPDSNNW